MLIATLLALLFLGSEAGLMLDGIDQMEDNIKSQIQNEDICKAVLDIVDRMEDTTKDYANADGDGEEDLLKLIHRYETTTAELQRNLDASYDQRIQYQQAMLALRFELKNTMSREQWDKVFQKTDQ